MNTLNTLESFAPVVFIFGWYPSTWILWAVVVLAGFEEQPLEHNMLTNREILSNIIGNLLVGDVGRFISLGLYFIFMLLYLLSGHIVAPVLAYILFIGLFGIFSNI